MNNRQWADRTSSPPELERRSEARNASEGELLLQLEGPAQRRIRVRLLDVSASGMRVAHECMELTTGQTLRVPAASGREIQVQVVWNRVVDGHVESGLKLLS